MTAPCAAALRAVARNASRNCAGMRSPSTVIETLITCAPLLAARLIASTSLSGAAVVGWPLSSMPQVSRIGRICTPGATPTKPVPASAVRGAAGAVPVAGGPGAATATRAAASASARTLTLQALSVPSEYRRPVGSAAGDLALDVPVQRAAAGGGGECAHDRAAEGEPQRPGQPEHGQDEPAQRDQQPGRERRAGRLVVAGAHRRLSAGRRAADADDEPDDPDQHEQ